MTPAPHVLGARQSHSHSCFHTCQPLAPIGLSPVAASPGQPTTYTHHLTIEEPEDLPKPKACFFLKLPAGRAHVLVTVLQHPSTQSPLPYPSRDGMWGGGVHHYCPEICFHYKVL